MAFTDYIIPNSVSPLQSYLEGAQGIQQLQNNNQVMQARQQAQVAAQQQAEQAQAAALQKQQMQVALYNAKDQNERARLTAQYMTAYPDDYKAVGEAAKTMSDAQRSSMQGLISKVSSAFNSNNIALGQQVLDEYVAGLQNSGAPDDQVATAKFYQQMYKSNPKAAISGLEPAARALDPASYDANNKVGVETQNAVAEEGRKVEMQPLEVAAKRASTEKTRADTEAVLLGMGLTRAQIAKTQVEAEQQLENLQNGGDGKAPTEGQAKANLFGTRAKNAATRATMLELNPDNIPHVPDALMRVANFTPEVLGGLTENQQSYLQYKRDFINAVLRKESGAAIGADEYESADQQYFPKLGDGEQVRAQKAANRADAASLILAEAGKFAGQGASSGAKSASRADIVAAAKANGVNPLDAMKAWKDAGNTIK